MRILLMIALLALAVFFCTGCLYTNIRTPYDLDLDKTALGPSSGEANIHSVLWLISWGDAGVADAAMDGGLTQVNHMDMEFLNILFGLYTRTTTVVYGE